MNTEAPHLGSASRPRIAALDAVRGFALCGILVANVVPIANLGEAAAPSPAASPEGAAGRPLLDGLHLLVDQRFFPIFPVLFGVGFTLLLESAARRGARPRPVLLRRLVVPTAPRRRCPNANSRSSAPSPAAAPTRRSPRSCSSP